MNNKQFLNQKAKDMTIKELQDAINIKLQMDKKTILQKYFDDCKKGEVGVMPYSEGDTKIKFVWTNKKGFGRIAELNLTKEGREEAWKLYKEIEKLNKKEEKKK